MLLIKTVALLCSDPAASPVDVFRDPRNHATATASVLLFAGNSVNFHPASQEPKALGQYLDQFVRRVVTFPGFTLVEEGNSYLELDGSLSQFEQSISEALEDPDAARALRDLVPDNSQDESSTDYILSLVSVYKAEGTDAVNVRLSRVYLTISSDATIPKQSARLVASSLHVIAPVLVANAESFAEKIQITRVPDFIDFFTSPKGFSRGDQVLRGSTSCFRTRQTFKDRQAFLSWLH